jgi:hypothetical protein
MPTYLASPLVVLWKNSRISTQPFTVPLGQIFEHEESQRAPSTEFTTANAPVALALGRGLHQRLACHERLFHRD